MHPAKTVVSCGELQEIERLFTTSAGDPYFHADRNCSESIASISAEAAIEFRKMPCPKCVGMKIAVVIEQMQNIEVIEIMAREAENIRKAKAEWGSLHRSMR